MKTIEEIYDVYLDCGSQAVTDTRKIDDNNKGALFFALSGDNFNGNKFANQALEKGCYHAIVDDPSLSNDDRCIVVENVLESLQQLATFHRDKFKGHVLAITGSNGKTTTKELIKACLSEQYSVLATKGNLNNHIGVPLTLLEIHDDHDIAVIEMGTNHPGEIMALAKIAKPDAALITSIGKAHLEGLGSVDGVAIEKLSLFDFVRSNKGHLFANIDSHYIQKYINQDSDDLIIYDRNTSLGFEIDVDSEFPLLKGKIDTGKTSHALQSSLFGQHNLLNISAALTVGFYFGVPISNMCQAIENLTLKNNRTETIQIGDIHYYLDAYNANPSSMTEALKAFGGSAQDGKMVILGDMFELGDDEVIEHQSIVDLASQYDWDIILVGSIFAQTEVPEKVAKFKSYEDLEEWFRNTTVANQEILIKGSRGMGLERLIEKYR